MRRCNESVSVLAAFAVHLRMGYPDVCSSGWKADHSKENPSLKPLQPQPDLPAESEVDVWQRVRFGGRLACRHRPYCSPPSLKISITPTDAMCRRCTRGLAWLSRGSIRSHGELRRSSQERAVLWLRDQEVLSSVADGDDAKSLALLSASWRSEPQSGGRRRQFWPLTARTMDRMESQGSPYCASMSRRAWVT